MSSSFDKKEDDPGGSSSLKTAQSSLFATSRSQTSVTEIGLVNNASKVSSFDDSIKRAPRGAPHRREASTSSYDSEDDVWNEGRIQDDPVGDRITKLLNEGGIPHFGYEASLREPPGELVESFQLYPLFSSKNYRALRQFLGGCWRGDRSVPYGTKGKRNMHYMRFMLEAFVVCYIAIYALNDIFLRSISELVWATVLGTISVISGILFDAEEVLSLLSFLTPSFCYRLVRKVFAMVRGTFGVVERELLWGRHFQGRSILWSDSGRLINFRRKHQRVMQFNKERRRLRKEVKKSKAERKRRKRKQLPFTPEEMDEMEQETKAHEQLETAYRKFTLRPPTFFADETDERPPSADAPIVADATERHMESLQYCDAMLFNCKQEQEEMKPVDIRATSSGSRVGMARQSSAVSPREAIEVVDHFPDIGSEIDAGGPSLSDESVGTAFSDHSFDMSYDGSDYSSIDEDDSASLMSYESESTAREMPWLVVGAKIGEKLLNSKKLRRLAANPDAAQKLIPDEAKRLMDDMNKEISPPSLNGESKAQSWEGPNTDNLSPTSLDLHQSKSNELDLKKPTHGMWTSPGSAAKSSRGYGAIAGFSPSRSQSLSVESLPPTETTNGNESRNGSPARNGIHSPPRLPQDGRSVGNALGYRTPPPSAKGAPSSTPSNGGPLASVATPPTSNLSRKLFRVSETAENPAPAMRLAPIEKGVKIVVPMFPPNGQSNGPIASGSCFYQMGTVMLSRRIYIPPNDRPNSRKRKTNCLAIKVLLDRALLRGSRFAEMNLRLMDEWAYVPHHSKFPMGSCVATTYGVGVLVGWRVEDDMHIIRSLWNRSGPGSGLAYLRRDCIHSVLEAAVGFDVQTTYGEGKVVAYVRGGPKNTTGKYFVELNGRHKGRAMEFNRCQILSCQGATFVPVTEHIRAAALYRLEVLHYKAKLREQRLSNPLTSGKRDKGMWRNFSEYVDLFANSFSKAISEDSDFDKEFDRFVSHIISLLEGGGSAVKRDDDDAVSVESDICEPSLVEETVSVQSDSTLAMVGWNMNVNELFNCFFVAKEETAESKEVQEGIMRQAQAFEEAHESAEILIRVLLRTITVARASVPDRPKLHIALQMIHEALLFLRQILRVQKANTSRKLVEAWFRALSELSETFGPLKSRMAALGVQVAKRFKKQGSIAKRRLLRFVDRVLGDTQLLQALELGDWKKAVSRLEAAIVNAGITDAETCQQLHKGAVLMYKNLAPRKKDRKSKAAAARNSQKMVSFGKAMKILASPGRSLMRLLTNDGVLDLFDRVLVRVFEKDPICSQVINIYAFNFDSVRHLRTLNNMSIAAKLWETVLDAVDEELTFASSEISEQTKAFIEPCVKLFSLGVAQFHLIQSGGSNADWLDFMMEDEAVGILQEVDYMLIDSLEALCNDIKQVVQVLPYMKTFDHDILNLMDEFNFDIFLKEIGDIVGDAEKSLAYMTDRSAILVERFLDYLPRMSIPIERVELQDGWVLTCRSKDGGDLRLSDLSVLRENLHLSVLGSENVFVPLRGKGYIGSPRNQSLAGVAVGSELEEEEEEGHEEAVLDEIRELILSAKEHGAWAAGVGGLKKPPDYSGVPRQLAGLPMPDQLLTQLDLWLTSSISDFELLETAIKEVSHQIQLQKEREENGGEPPSQSSQSATLFDPQVDPTVLFLDIRNLTLCLEEFGFRVEKGEPLTIFDPVFEGCASIIVKNVSIALRVEVKKERAFRDGLETPRPVLQLAEFEVGLEKLKLEFLETGADWILNGILKGFSGQTTEIVKDSLKEQIKGQIQTVLEQVNGFVDANPDLLLNALGIKMRDLEERIAV
ncbi:hypothetical protein ACHAXT_009355 [Thalassiosira profunda]